MTATSVAEEKVAATSRRRKESDCDVSSQRKNYLWRPAAAELTAVAKEK